MRVVEHQAVEAPEKGGEGFAGAGGSEDQGAFAARDGGPAEALRRGGGAERGTEPVAGDGMEESEWRSMPEVRIHAVGGAEGSRETSGAKSQKRGKTEL
jgi:hypothetical protein